MTLLQTLYNVLPMNVASLSFVYVYLPVCLFAYYVSPVKLRTGVLLAASLGFYALSSPGSFWLIIISILVDYNLIQVIRATARPFWKRTCLWLCILINIVFVGFFGIAAQTGALTPPLGLVIYCLSGIDAAIEAYKGEGQQRRGFIGFAAYMSFFPRLYAGPLVEPPRFFGRGGQSGFSAADAMTGFNRFAAGLLKYAAVGRGLYWLHNSVKAIPAESVSVLSAWSLALSLMLSVYFLLSGLSDIASGIAGMFGLELPVNFYYPYQAHSITDFFERFNMTVGRFLKRTLLPVLSGISRDPAGDCLNMLLVGMVWGAWFGMRINYILWGSIIAVFMMMEKYVYPRIVGGAPILFRRCYTFIIVILSFAVFAGGSVTESLRSLKWMLGADAIPILNDRIMYLYTSNWMLLLISCFFATSAANRLANLVRSIFPRSSGILAAALGVFFLALFTALSLGGGAA